MESSWLRSTVNPWLPPFSWLKDEFFKANETRWSSSPSAGPFGSNRDKTLCFLPFPNRWTNGTLNRLIRDKSSRSPIKKNKTFWPAIRYTDDLHQVGRWKRRRNTCTHIITPINERFQVDLIPLRLYATYACIARFTWKPDDSDLRNPRKVQCSPIPHTNFNPDFFLNGKKFHFSLGKGWC